MSIREWTPESVSMYTRAIEISKKQRKIISDRKEKWINDFINGKPVEQFDEYVNRNKE